MVLVWRAGIISKEINWKGGGLGGCPGLGGWVKSLGPTHSLRIMAWVGGSAV